MSRSGAWRGAVSGWRHRKNLPFAALFGCLKNKQTSQQMRPFVDPYGLWVLSTYRIHHPFGMDGCGTLGQKTGALCPLFHQAPTGHPAKQFLSFTQFRISSTIGNWINNQHTRKILVTSVQSRESTKPNIHVNTTMTTHL